MYVAFVPQASSEWRAGLRPGDRITTLDGRRSGCGAPWRTSWWPAPTGCATCSGRATESPMRGFFQLRKEQWDDEFGQHYERYVFRTDHWLPRGAGPHGPQPAPPRLRAAAGRRGDGERHQVHRRRACCGSLQGRVSLSSVSGPITMYDIAGQAGRPGDHVLRVGDGGHLGEPGPPQPAAHPGARRRAPALFPVRSGAPAPAPAAHPRGGEPGGDGDAGRCSCWWPSRTTSSAAGTSSSCRCASSGRDTARATSPRGCWCAWPRTRPSLRRRWRPSSRAPFSSMRGIARWRRSWSTEASAWSPG